MTPPRRLAAFLRAPAAHAVGLGALAALGQAPWGLWPLTILSLAALAVLVARAPGVRAAFWRGWFAGAAQFGVALGWVVEPFFVEPAVTGWMAPFAVVLLAGGLALFWGGAALIAAATNPRGVRRVWIFVLAMLAFEDLRGYLFTGFPWTLSGHIWIGWPPDQIAALGGALLLGALTLGLSAALATVFLRWRQGRRRRAMVVLATAALALGGAWGWGLARLAQPAPPAPGVQLRLVQANIPQADKWRRDLIEPFFRRHLDLSALPATVPPDLVIWPETAAPFFLDRPGDGLVMAAQSAGAPVIMGIQRRDDGAGGFRHYFNSLAVIDAGGAVTATYDKYHLVPFGEYVPLLGEWAERQGWGGLAARMVEGYTPGPGPAILDLGAAGRALPLICYEAVFARGLRTPERPDWIVQITNDAWFGASAGPWQHLAQARLRAIETGLPLARAANTGISAMIDARGRLTASLGLNETGVVDAPLPGARPEPPYARTGDAPWHGVLGLGMLVLLAAVLRRRKAIDDARPTG